MVSGQVPFVGELEAVVSFQAEMAVSWWNVVEAQIVAVGPPAGALLESFAAAAAVPFTKNKNHFNKINLSFRTLNVFLASCNYWAAEAT